MVKTRQQKEYFNINMSKDIMNEISKGINLFFKDKNNTNNIKDFNSCNSENLEEQKEKRRLHYDSLLWNSTSIFLGAIIIMLAQLFSSEFFMNNNFPTILKIGIFLLGFIFTVSSFYFAVSFRELRHNFGKPPCEKGLPKALLKQWFLFVLVFLVLEIVWLLPLFYSYPDLNVIWTSLLCIGIIITLFLDLIINGIKDSIRNYYDDILKNKK